MPTLKPTRNLVEAVERVSAKWFASVLHPHVGWGKRTKLRRKPVGIVCASYRVDDNAITVHPVFDDPRVPRWALDWVLFHEMLHMVHGPRHSNEFYAHEARHPHTKRVESWVHSHLFDIAWKQFRE